MADNTNVTLDKRPYTQAANFFSGGGALIGAGEYALDPNDTPVLFRLRSRALPVPANPYARATANFNALTVLAGDTVTVYGRVFTAADSPQAGQFLTSAVAPDAAILVDTLAQAINEDPVAGPLVSASRITGGGTFLQLVARGTGLAWNLNGGQFVSTISGFTAVFQNTTDGSRAQQLQRYGYGFWLNVYAAALPLNFFDGATLAPNIQWRLVKDLVQDYGGVDFADFEVSKYLKPLSTPPVPAYPTGPGFTRYASAAYAYKVEGGEYFTGGIATTGANPEDYGPALSVEDAAATEALAVRCFESGVRWTAAGAFPQHVIPDDYYRWWSGVRLSGSVNSYSALLPVTEQPELKLVRRTGDYEFVWFWFIRDLRYGSLVPALRARVVYTFHDGSTFTQTYATGSGSSSGLYSLPFSTNGLLTAVETSQAKRVDTFALTVETDRDNSGTWIEVCTQAYEVDTVKDTKRYRTFWWRARFGCWDSFTFEGVERADLSVERTTFRRGMSRERGVSLNTGRTLTYEARPETSRTQATGWVDRTHMDWLRGIAAATEVWTNADVSYWDEATGQQRTRTVFVAVDVRQTEWATDAREKLFNLTLEWVPAVPDNVRTA